MANDIKNFPPECVIRAEYIAIRRDGQNLVYNFIYVHVKFNERPGQILQRFALIFTLFIPS